MKKLGRPRSASRPKAKGVVIGLAGMAKISAVEGLRMTADMKRTFRTLDRQGASAQKRRAVLIKKYGTQS